jgi:hypothetical protein
VRLLDPTDPVDALVALAHMTAGLDVSRRGCGDSSGKATRPALQEQLRASDGLALAAANKGWSEAALYRTLANPQYRGGEKVQKVLRSQGERAARVYVARLWRKAYERVRQSPATHPGAAEACALVDAVRVEAERSTWPGMRGATDLAVLRAHLDIAAESAA